MRLIKMSLMVTLLINLAWAEFDPARFNFGADWEYPSKNGKINELKGVLDYWTIWIHENEFIPFWHGAMLDTCSKYGQTPVFYGYLIAGLSGLGDADQGGKLDAEGGAWLRSNIGKVVQTYEAYAQKIASRYGTSKPSIWLMEPDFSQYCDGDGQDLSVADAAKLMSQLIGAVKKYLPSAYFSLDISPWNNDQASYLKNFDLSQVSFMSNSGGRTQAGSDRIRNDANNNVTWAQVNSASGKCIIADAGYGVGGKPTGHASDWDDINNIKNRMKDGVLAVTHKDPQTGWGNTVKSLKSSLSGVSSKCSDFKFDIKYALAVTASSGGKVTKSPDALTYTSGTMVTLTAVPNSGYKFAAWSGDTTGSASTITVKMTKDMSITAVFVDVNAKTQFALTINVSGSGVVKTTPESLLYDSGTTVALEAFVVNGATFTQWGGAVSGSTNPALLVMSGNKVVNASFTGENVNTTNLVKNGSFVDGTSDWDFGAYEDGKAEGEVVNGEFKFTLTQPGTEKWMIQLMQPGVTLDNGKRYVFSFYGYAQSETKIAANIGMPVDPFTSYLRERAVTFTTTKTKYEYTFTMSKTTTSDARIEFNGGLATSSWFIDNVELKEELEIGVAAPAPSHRVDNVLAKSGSDSRVVISWYDHAGRLLHTVSGDQSILAMRNTFRFNGSAVAVVNNGGQRLVYRTVNLTK